MAVVTRPCGDFYCVRSKSCIGRTSRTGWVIPIVVLHYNDLVTCLLSEFVNENSGLVVQLMVMKKYQ